MREERVDGFGHGAALSVRTTESTLERMRGLLGRPALRESEAMVISPCNMVHTIGMSYPIDVVFADRHGVVLRISPRVVPSRMRMCLRAKYVVEMKAGEAARRSWTRGTRLAFLVASKEAS